MSDYYFEALLAKARQRLADAVAAIGEVKDFAIVKHRERDSWLAVLPDVSGLGRWRLQSFDTKGFSGHMIFSSKTEAIVEAASQHCTVRDDGALDRLQDTVEFKIGLFAIEQLMLLNRGEISFDSYCEGVSNFRKQLAAA